MKKQIIIDYDEYQEMLRKIENMTRLLAKVYFSDNTDEALKEWLGKENEKYGWWI